MSADNRIVIFRVRGRVYAREVLAWSDLLSPDKNTAWEKAEYLLQRPGPLLRDAGQAIEYANSIVAAINRQGDQLEYTEPLCLEFDPDNRQVREITLAAA